MLHIIEVFEYTTYLGLKMGYYNIQLINNTSYLCTTILPWGKYKYKSFL